MPPGAPSTPFVVGIDGSESALSAVRWAAVEAALRSAELHLVTVVPAAFTPGVGFQPAETNHREASHRIAVARKTARDVTDSRNLTITSEIADGQPIPVLLERSTKARMLVTGTNGLGRIGRILLGSVSTAMARHARCPVAVIPRSDDAGTCRRSAPVVVGVDGSICAANAVEVAFEQAAVHHVGLVAVTVWAAPSYYIPRSEMQQQAQTLMADVLTGYLDRYPGVDVECVVCEGRAAQQLLKSAEHAGVIVVGSHGRGGFPGMTLGSVSQKILHGARVPVVVARAP
ncbi:universal stress protein [Nocardia farcinica]|nr:universal stress protein [Nocardia farcinica]